MIFYLFASSIFTSAFLVFLVQPVTGKVLLPLAGGSPAVWLACVFFFQSTLLAGYLYTHLSIRFLGTKIQSILHFALTLFALSYLPLDIPQTALPPTNTALWIYFRLTSSIGLPFLIVSSLSPLLQLWYSKTSQKNAADPYFLYAASNIGSFAALLAYPLIIEPVFTISQQLLIWSAVFASAGLLAILCRLQADSAREPDIIESTIEPDLPVNRHTIEYWVVCAFVPSSMLLGVTLFLTTDLAPLPLLWILPLMIYLGTYAMAFSQFCPSVTSVKNAASLSILAFPMAYFFKNPSFIAISIPLNLFIFASISLFCHQQIALNRPPVKHLTSFYAWLSIGGVLGGLFNSIIAPHIFASLLEYPMMIVLAALIISRTTDQDKHNNNSEQLFSLSTISNSVIIGIFFGGFLHSVERISINDLFRRLCLYWAKDINTPPFSEIISLLRNHNLALLSAVLLIASLSLFSSITKKKNCNLFFLSAMTMITLSVFSFAQNDTIIFATRNFFGRISVTQKDLSKVRVLYHGSTVHGAQFTSGKTKFKPLTYYHPEGPVGDIFSLALAQKPDFKACVIGLGIGCLAAYSQPEQEFTFIEIDQDIIDLAESDVLFTYITDNASQCHIICGDGRFKIQEFPPDRFDMILIDAFSSDSIPIHLLTLEAINMYISRLKPDGFLVFHVSNRYLRLDQILVAAARDLNLKIAEAIDNSFDAKAPANRMRFASHYVIVAKDIKPFSVLIDAPDKKWVEITKFDTKIKAWTDNYSSILPILGKLW